MFIVLSCSCLLPIQWSQASSRDDDVVGAEPTVDAPTTSEWLTILLPAKMRLVLLIWHYMENAAYRSKNITWMRWPLILHRIGRLVNTSTFCSIMIAIRFHWWKLETIELHLAHLHITKAYRQKSNNTTMQVSGFIWCLYESRRKNVILIHDCPCNTMSYQRAMKIMALIPVNHVA